MQLYKAMLIAFREVGCLVACTYLLQGFAVNHYLAEGSTGRTVLTEHLDWHPSNVNCPEWAVDFLDFAACKWTHHEIDFVYWVFNAAPEVKEPH